MQKDSGGSGRLQRTTLDPSRDVVELGAYVPPVGCEGCDGRVDVFSRYNENTEARCGGCGSTWEITDPTRESDD